MKRHGETPDGTGSAPKVITGSVLMTAVDALTILKDTICSVMGERLKTKTMTVWTR